MLKIPPDLSIEVPEAPVVSAPMSSSSAIVAALIAGHAEPRALCALVASTIVSSSSSTCGSRGAIAAAFADLATLGDDAVGELLRGRTC